MEDYLLKDQGDDCLSNIFVFMVKVTTCRI